MTVPTSIRKLNDCVIYTLLDLYVPDIMQDSFGYFLLHQGFRKNLNVRKIYPKVYKRVYFCSLILHTKTIWKVIKYFIEKKALFVKRNACSVKVLIVCRNTEW